MTKNEKIAVAILLKARELKRIGIMSAVCVSMSACGVHSTLPTDNGRILIDADAKGMQAFFDGQNGLITNGKASPDIDTAHWRTRRDQEAEVTKREYAPSFLSKLFGTDQPGQTVDKAPTRSAQVNKIQGVSNE